MAGAGRAKITGKPVMERKEAIIRHLGQVIRANRNQIAEAIRADPQVVSSRLVELRRTGIVRYMKWADESKGLGFNPRGLPET